MSLRIEIGRVPMTMIATTTRDRAEQLERRLRDDVARGLAPAIAAACASVDAGYGYVFIDRLRVDCAVSAQWSADATARALAEQVGQALLRGVSAPDAIRFRDREEYLPAFVNDVAAGGAASRWWFDEFAGLRALPASSAIRTVIVNEGEI